MSLVYQCQPTYAATMAGSPIPAGRSAPICTTGQGVWVDTSVAFATEYEAYIAQHPPTPIDDLALIGVTPEAVAASIAFGFGTIVSFWFVGYMGGLGKKAVNQA